MKLLKLLIAEEVQRAVRRSAGFGGSSGVGGRGRGSIEVLPTGLGSEEEVEEEYGKEQQKNQFAARVSNRTTGQDRT
jgi:hypothetical protein